MKELLLFHVGALQYGIALPLVKSIQSAKPMVVGQRKDKNPIARRIDGEETLLYDLLPVFEKKASYRHFENEKLIIVDAEPRPVGLIVSRVDGVISADRNRIEPLAVIFKDLSLSCFSGVLKHESSLVLLLKPGGIVKAAQQNSEPQNCTDIADIGNASSAMADIPLGGGQRRTLT